MNCFPFIRDELLSRFFLFLQGRHFDIKGQKRRAIRLKKGEKRYQKIALRKGKDPKAHLLIQGDIFGSPRKYQHQKNKTHL